MRLLGRGVAAMSRQHRGCRPKRERDAALFLLARCTESQRSTQPGMQRSIATLGKRTLAQPRTALAPFSSFASSSYSSSSAAHIAGRPLPRPRRASYKGFSSSSRVTRADEPHSYTIRSVSNPRGRGPLARDLTPKPTPPHSQLTDREYHDVADKTMDRLTEYLEETIEAIDSDQAAAYDVEYSVSRVDSTRVSE